MTVFEDALKHTLGIEGGYSDDARDSGGKTRWGITEAKARAWGYTGEMSTLPKELAIQIYRTDFWDAIQLDRVAALSPELAREMFDTAVNCGVGKPVLFLQRLLNVLNWEGADFPDLVVDGVIGAVTLAALRAFLTRRGNLGARVLVAVMNSQQAVFYMELAERRPKDEAFTFGWFVNRVLEAA